MRFPSASSRRQFLRTAGLLGTAGLVAPLLPGQPKPPTPPAAGRSPAADVKITGVRCHLLPQPQISLVEVTTDAGVTGWGECAWDGEGLMANFVNDLLAKQCVGQSLHDVRRHWDWMFYENHDLGPGGALPNAIAGVDIALWDARGRLLGLPVYQLLGGAYRDKIEAYGSVPVRRGRVSIEDCVKRCVQFVEQGYQCVKVRMQIREHHLNPDPDPTFGYVAAVRQAVGDKIELMVDANNGYSASRAIQTGRKLHEKWGVNYFEDPVSDQNHLEMAQVVAALDQVEIVAGEKCYTRWQIKDLITQGQVDIINPDIVKVGGFTEMDRIHHLATCYQKPIQLHNTRPTISTAASLHAMATFSQVARYLEFPIMNDRLEAQAKLFHQDVRPRNGWLHLPTGPGLGLEPDVAAIRAAARR
jgi:L-alanine-DL-glutamate epimerase-like enolase superfamily enzyme